MTRLVLLPSPLLGPAVWAPGGRPAARRRSPVSVPGAGRCAWRTPGDVVAGCSRSCRRPSRWCWCRTATPGCTSPRWPPPARSRRWSSSTPGCPRPRRRPPPRRRRSASTWPTLADGRRAAPAVDAAGGRPRASTTCSRTPPRVPRSRPSSAGCRCPTSRPTCPRRPGWERLPAAYLAFGDTYADERAEAVAGLADRRRCPAGTCTSWSTRRLWRRRCCGCSGGSTRLGVVRAFP